MAPKDPRTRSHTLLLSFGCVAFAAPLALSLPLRGLEALVAAEVAELSPDPDHLYDNCAEWYYDIQVLAANQPGWDK